MEPLYWFVSGVVLLTLLGFSWVVWATFFRMARHIEIMARDLRELRNKSLGTNAPLETSAPRSQLERDGW